MSQHLAEARRALRNAQRRKWRVEASQKLKAGAIDFHRRVAVHLRDRCGGRTEVALDYLTRKGCHREGGQPWTSSDVLEWSETISAEPSADAAVISAAPSPSTELKAAQQFLLERRMYDWVRHQNEVKGLTPTITDTLVQYGRLADDPSAEAESTPLSKTRSGSRSGGSDGGTVGMSVTATSRLECACHWSSGVPRQRCQNNRRGEHKSARHLLHQEKGMTNFRTEFGCQKTIPPVRPKIGDCRS